VSAANGNKNILNELNLKMKSIKNLDKYAKLSIAIIIIGIIIRFYLASIYHVSGDACWQLSNARYIANNLKFPLFENFGRDEPFWAPPLFHMLIASVYIIFKNISIAAAEFAVKFVSPLFGSLGLVFSFLVAKKLYNSKIAFYSVIFLAFIPLSLDYGVFSYVDGMLAFLAVLSVYFALENRIVLSGIAAGLAILTKYNGIFILPVLLYIAYSNNKNNENKNEFYKKFLLILIIPAIIGSIWFIRNWIYLGNPVWPFLNDIFQGYDAKSFSATGVGSVEFSKIFSMDALSLIYLGIFGVPNGSIKSLYFFDIPYLKILISLWILGTLIFIFPLFAGISKKLKHKWELSIWVISYFALCLLYVVNAGWSIIRFMLPAFPAIAMIWACGLERIKSFRMGNLYSKLIFLIAIGLVFTSFVKINLASKEWNLYNEDFDWIKSNTKESDIFLTGSQCISYNINRQAISPEAGNFAQADYLFYNKDFRLDQRASISSEVFSEAKKKGQLAYANDKTGTEIYKLR